MFVYDISENNFCVLKFYLLLQTIPLKKKKQTYIDFACLIITPSYFICQKCEH